MARASVPAGPRAASVLFIVVAALAAAYFTQLRFELTGENHRARLPALVEGTADTPFQYRVLVPWLVGRVLRVEAVRRAAGSPLDLFRATEFLATFLLLLAFRRYVGEFIANRVARDLLAIGIFGVLVIHFVLPREIPFWYPSDIPALLFFTLGLLWIRRGLWVAFYPLFVVATFNRETTLFLTLAWLLVGLGRERPALLAGHVAAQLAIWTGIKAWLHATYAANPGAGLLEITEQIDGRPHVLVNLEFLARPEHWPSLLAAFGFAWIPCVIGFRAIRDRFARRTLLVALAYGTVALFVGNVYELRVYGELAPIVLVGAILAAGTWTGLRNAAEPAGSGSSSPIRESST